MSSSFFQPSVTPSTALFTRLRARPWNLLSSGSSEFFFVTMVPSSTAATMPGGSACFICPLGPFTSTPLASALMVTPLGTVIGFFPIRDIAVLPNVAEDFAADAGLLRGPARHHATGRRQDRYAESAEHRRHFVAARIHAPAGTANALDARNGLLAGGAVLQEQSHLLTRGLAGAFAGRLDHLEARDVALVLQNPGDLGLQFRGRHLDARMARRDGVPDPGQHVGNRICHLFVLSLGTARTRRTVRTLL